MSFLLEPDTYASVHSLFEDMTCHLAVVTVLAGILKGRIYVDDPARPRTAIFHPSNRHRVYVSGEPEPHLLADVIHLLSNESLEQSYGFVMYDDISHPWQPALEQVLQKQEIDSLMRQFYRLREPSWRARVLRPLSTSAHLTQTRERKTRACRRKKRDTCLSSEKQACSSERHPTSLKGVLSRCQPERGGNSFWNAAQSDRHLLKC